MSAETETEFELPQLYRQHVDRLVIVLKQN
jgi:hypothetical protein